MRGLAGSRAIRPAFFAPDIMPGFKRGCEIVDKLYGEDRSGTPAPDGFR